MESNINYSLQRRDVFLSSNSTENDCCKRLRGKLNEAFAEIDRLKNEVTRLQTIIKNKGSFVNPGVENLCNDTEGTRHSENVDEESWRLRICENSAVYSKSKSDSSVIFNSSPKVLEDKILYFFESILRSTPESECVEDQSQRQEDTTEDVNRNRNISPEVTTVDFYSGSVYAMDNTEKTTTPQHNISNYSENSHCSLVLSTKSKPPEKPKKLSHSCTVRKKVIRSKVSFRNHGKSHCTEKPFKCDTCGTEFAVRYSYLRHLTIHASKSVKCSDCEKIFANVDDRNHHYKLVHNRIPRFKCSYCDKTFPDSTNFRRHERRHLGIKNHVCVTCGKRFSEARNLRSHLTTQHGTGENSTAKVSQNANL